MISDECKVNWGTLAEIPEISVNRFGSLQSKSKEGGDVNWKTTRAFFMTHYDDQIRKDVMSKSFLNILEDSANDCRLYLHEIMYNYLQYYTTTIYVDEAGVGARLEQLKQAKRIVFLEVNRPIGLRFQPSAQEDGFLDVNVTALSSGSNIGCVMLLFECLGKVEKRILHTGDCRVTLKDLSGNTCLRNPDGSVKKINKIYLDTTFCLEEAKEFPARNQVTEELIAAIGIDIKCDPTKHFDIWTPLKVYHVTFLQKLGEKYPQQGIHVPPNMADFLQKIPELASLLHSGSRESDRFHFDCGESCDNEFCGNGKEWAIEFDVTPVTLDCSFNYSYEWPKKIMSSPDEDEKQWCKNGLKVYRRNSYDIRGIYSSHMSRFEIGRFLNFFGLDYESVIPLHKSKDMNCLEFEILLEMACADGKVEPEDLVDELPSHFYDYTLSIKSALETSEKEPQQYVHQTKNAINK